MNTGSLLTGIGLGAALAFALDPNTGTRRRALMRDQLVRASRKTRHGLDATARDLTNRSRGLVASTRARWSDESVGDERLLERVRAKLGRATSHPRAIDVEVRDGHVTLRGPILAHEVPRLLVTVSNVRGVQSVANELDARGSAEGVPSLQGSAEIPPSAFSLRGSWSPSAQALVAVTGLAATGVWLASRR
jgi:osmotically-inducible protein OsmY